MPLSPLPSSSPGILQHRISNEKAKAALDCVHAFFTNHSQYDPQVRRAAAERVLLTLLKNCSEVALRQFFIQHIPELMATVEAKETKVRMQPNCSCTCSKHTHAHTHTHTHTHSQREIKGEKRQREIERGERGERDLIALYIS